MSGRPDVGFDFIAVGRIFADKKEDPVAPIIFAFANRSLDYEAAGSKPNQFVDRNHRLMLLWKRGDVHEVDEYLDEHGLRRRELFLSVVKSFI
jgi:hypothetical protein